MTTLYAVQGLYRGQWTTIFAGYGSAAAAKERMAKLKERNPACQYRVVNNKA